ncbi:MAG: hypothetical protein PHQ19_02335 [Candidatus Krumholzibacteria bacterium]|nr:hypothetical protein [Candidatus Krumholzibacteria bacterium]
MSAPHIRSAMSRHRTVFMPFAALVFLCIGGSALGAGIQIIPADPTDHDYIVIRIIGARPDTCWRLGGFQCLPVEGNTFPVSVFWVDDWEPGLGCGDMIVDFVEHCCPGVLLPPGTYTVVVTEHNDSLRETGTFVTTLEFTIDSVIGMRQASWGAIKMIHR